MEESSLSDQLLFLRRHLILVGVVILGLIVLGYGLILLVALSKEESITFEPHSEEKTTPLSGNSSEITIDIAGAVEKPGVYTLPSDARLQDAITSAGGIREDANHEAIAKAVNLAQKLSDSTKVYIPFKGEAVAGIASGTNASSLVNINAASLSELDKLPKIGAVTAQKIIDNRPYATIQDLVTKKAVSASVLKAIEALISAQ